MKLYYPQLLTDLMCDMEDGSKPFGMGWVQNTDYTRFYCLCRWMTDDPKDLHRRPWLSPTAYPEGHTFTTESEAMQALMDCATVAVLGGFRGRTPGV